MSQVNLAALVSFDVKGLSLLSQVSTKFQDIGRSAQRTGETLDRASAGGHAFVGAAEALAKSVPRLMKDFGDFELAVQRAKGVMGTASIRQKLAIEQLVTTAKGMRDVEFSPTAIATGVLELNKAGIEGSRALREIRTTLDLATVGGMTLERSAVTLANVVNAWGTPFTTGRDLLNEFVTAANATTFEVNSLFNAMTYAQGAAQTFGQSLSETLAMVTAVSPLTGPTSKAGTVVRSFLASLGDEKKQERLKELGVELTSGGKFRGGFDIMADYIQKTAGMEEEQRVALTRKLFDKRGMDFYSTVRRMMTEGVVSGNTVVTGRGAIDTWRAKIKEGNVSLEHQAKLVRESLPMAWERFKANTSRALIAVGEALKPFAMAVMGVLQPMMGALEYIASSGVGKVLAFGAAMMAVGGAFSMLRRVAVGFGLFGGGAGAVGAGIGGGAVPFWATALNAIGAGAFTSGSGASSVFPRVSVGQRIGNFARENFGVESRFGGFSAIPGMMRSGADIGGKVAGGLGRFVGGATGILGGLATGVAGVLGPIGLLATAAWGLSEIFDSMRESEQRQQDRKNQLSGAISNLPLVGQAIRAAALAGNGPSELAPHVVEAYNNNLLTRQMIQLGSAQVRDLMKKNPGLSADQASKMATNAQSAIQAQQIGLENMSQEQKVSLLGQWATERQKALAFAGGTRTDKRTPQDEALAESSRKDMLERLENPMAARYYIHAQNVHAEDVRMQNQLNTLDLDAMAKKQGDEFGRVIANILVGNPLSGTLIVQKEDGKEIGTVGVSSAGDRPAGSAKID